MKLPCLLQFRILKLALTSLFSRPYTTRYPAKEYEPIDEFRGKPCYSEDDCIGCGACAEVCPADCIDMTDDVSAVPPARTLVHHADHCIFCGQCERYCTTEKGITLSTEYDLAGFEPDACTDEVKKDLLLCGGCGCVIAPVEQIRWLADRLGPLVYANPTLMLVSHGELTVVDEGDGSEGEDVQRAQHVSIQCPRCRRKTALVI